MFKKALFVLFVALCVYMGIRDNKKRYNSEEVKGLRVVITGSSTGIGEEIAYQLAAMGANIMVTAPTESKLKQVVAKCKKLGSPDAHYLAVSMYSYDNASLVIKTAVEKLGGIDLLILNHMGQTYFGGYHYDIRDVESLLVSNTLTHAHMATVAMDHLKESKGRIVVTSSSVGLTGGPFVIPYATTKYALNGFFTSLRHELNFNNTDVSVSIAYIGYIATNRALQIQKHLKEQPAPVEECAAEIIRGGITRDEEIYFPSQIAWAPVVNALFPRFVDQKIQENYLNMV